jgi:hypothetical protein
MQVPLLDLKEQNDALRPEIEKALGRVLDTNAFILAVRSPSSRVNWPIIAA